MWLKILTGLAADSMEVPVQKYARKTFKEVSLNICLRLLLQEKVYFLQVFSSEFDVV